MRGLGIALLAGVGAGVLVGGVGSRLVMRISGFAAGQAAVGLLTENGNRVGDVTLPGTFELVSFVGVFTGIYGGALYAAVAPVLAPLGRWKGIAFGLGLLALFGSTVINSGNVDFRRFGPSALNVVLFAAIFLAFGVVFALLFDRLDEAAEGRVVRTLGAVAVAGAGLLLAISTLQFLGALLRAGLEADDGFVRGFALAYAVLGSGLVGRAYAWRTGRAHAYALLALPLFVGAALTVREFIRILA